MAGHPEERKRSIVIDTDEKKLIWIGCILFFIVAKVFFGWYDSPDSEIGIWLT